LETGIAASRDANPVLIEPGIDDFLAHVGIIHGQYQDYLQIIISLEKRFERIIKHRFVAEQQELFRSLATHSGTCAAGYDDRVFLHKGTKTRN
jgi:hypothetical protein